MGLDQDLRGANQLDQNQVRSDLEVLKTAVRQGYGGSDFTQSLDELSTKFTSSAEFCEALAQVLAQVNDAHLRALVDFQVCGQAYPPGYVGRNLARDTWTLSQAHHRGQSISVLAIPRFWPGADARWNRFLKTVKDLRQQNQPFVIDLRGNSGGDDDQGFEMARILLGLPADLPLPTPFSRREFRQTPTAFALLANNWTWQILRLQSRGQTVPVYMNERREEILGWMTRAQNHEFPEVFEDILPDVRLDQRQLFNPAVYILVDRLCASACETTLQVLEKLPNRILVGENTAGMVHFGDMGRVVLPNSHVVINLPTMAAHFRDGRQVEKQGYAPDLRVAPGGDALMTALAHIFP